VDWPETSEIEGEVLDGRYKIIELIGEGGMGRVYRAEHLRLQRSVAIKVLHRSYSATPAVGRRFEREAVALARLDHPNCVAVQDFGRLLDGSLFLVMSYLQGLPLRAALDHKPFPIARALHVARHLLTGLAHAHQAGIVHRDVKPDNVMLVQHEGDADFAKLFDFGIVKLLQGGSLPPDKLTAVGQRFGTPAYMSPEQALGRAIDARTDLYSLTVVLYEMLTGRPPFVADDEEGLLVMHAAKSPPSLVTGARERTFPREVEELVRRGLSKNPEHRPASADEYLAALDACANALAPLAPRSGSLLASSTEKLLALSGRFRVAGKKSRALRSRRMLVVGLCLLFAGAAFALHRTLGADPAVHAHALLAGGRPLEAVAYLQERAKKTADNARAQLELGHAYAALRRYDEALVAYERVPALDRPLADDRAMRTDLMAMLGEAHNETAVGAARLLIKRLDDEGARARVVELASRHRSPARRAAMRDLAASLGLLDRVDLFASYRLDLEQGATCADRQRAVAKLRALKDPSAVAVLRTAQARRGNACLRDDAADAVRRLDSLVAYDPFRSLDRADERAMRTNLMLLLDDVHNETATAAARFLIQILDDEGARTRVVELASRHRSPAHRAAMRDLAASLGLSDRVDLLTSYRLDLEQEATCADRQRALAKLRALRDPAALPAIRKAQARKVNACLRDDAADAIRYLESLVAPERP
jgi:tetratricopeptide (TPR) repeat protein